MAKSYKNSERFNSKQEWEGKHIESAYWVVCLWKICNPTNLDYLLKNNIIKKTPKKPIYKKEAVKWDKLFRPC